MGNKWIAVVGSPRAGGNTDQIVEFLIEALTERNISVDKHLLSSVNINTCNGCECCMESGSCRIQDDVSELISSMKTADGFIFASPTYNYSMTAQMKAFFDRTFCLNDYSEGCKSRLPKGQKAILVGVCAGKDKEAMGFAVEGMHKIVTELDISIIDAIEYFDTKHNPVAESIDLREAIYKRVRKNRKLDLL